MKKVYKGYRKLSKKLHNFIYQISVNTNYKKSQNFFNKLW